VGVVDRLDGLEETRVACAHGGGDLPSLHSTGPAQSRENLLKMKRFILVVLAVGAFVSVMAGSGCSSGGGVGDPCIPEQEYDTCFAGFSINSVDTETKSFQCQTRVCLVNHFQGRVSCPYGQTAGMNDLSGAPYLCGTGVVGGPTTSGSYEPYAGYSSTGFEPCTIPGGSAVSGTAASKLLQPYETQVQVTVTPQVLERNTANAVYCSCRCADENGDSTNGVFCSCPDGYVCTQLVASIGAETNQGLTGAYCMKSGTKYNPSASADCNTGACCQPGVHPCP